MIRRFDAFVTGITVCYKYIQRIKSAEMTEFGLKGTHVMCLFYLNQNPAGLTAAQLRNLCAEDKAAISRTVADLRGRGFVISDSEKNYRAPLRLTEAGHTIAKKVEELIEGWVTAGGDGLNNQERIDFYRSLAKISDNIRSKMEQNPKFNET